MFDKLRKIIPDLSKAKVIEAIIDPETHLEYIEYASKLSKEQINNEDIIEESDNLFSSETTIAEKKRLLTLMAKIDDVSIFRKIEQYSQKPDKELLEWSKIAQQESLTLIQSSLLEEEQILISTGLGGKGNKIRFFIVLKANNIDKFSDFQEKAIKNEINFSFKNNECDLEKLEFGDYFFSVTALFPLNFEIIEKTLISTIEELKNIGIELSEKYILTNVKTISLDEIENLFKEMEQKSKSSGLEDLEDLFGVDFDDLDDFEDYLDGYGEGDDDDDDDDNNDDDDEEDDDDKGEDIF